VLEALTGDKISVGRRSSISPSAADGAAAALVPFGPLLAWKRGDASLFLSGGGRRAGALGIGSACG
jgi:hypothetical protein